MDKKIFKWNQYQARGAVFFIFLVVVFQSIYFLVNLQPESSSFALKEDSLLQDYIDSLVYDRENRYKKYTFNPNYITQYKAYQLGISPTQYDKLIEFREKGKFINSALEFKNVTGISDSLFDKISPLFKFPDWVKNNKNTFKGKYNDVQKTYTKNASKKDINKATAEQLMEINGIGDKLSDRIIKYRQRIKGFSIKSQMKEVWGLEDYVIERIWDKFDIIEKPVIEKISLNEASVDELKNIPYLNYKQAKEIVILRTKKGNIKEIEELLEIESITTDKIEILKLYLYI